MRLALILTLEGAFVAHYTAELCNLPMFFVNAMS